MHDQSTPSQPGTTETVATRAAGATIGALGLAAAIGLSSGGHDILGASLGIAAAGGVILIDHLAARRRIASGDKVEVIDRCSRLPFGEFADQSILRGHLEMGDRGKIIHIPDDDLSIPSFAPPPTGADTRDPAPASPSRAGSRTPLLPPGLKAPVMDFSPLVQAALLVLSDADDIPHRDGLAGVEPTSITRLRRAVSAEIETRVRATAAYPKAADLKAMR